MKFLKNTLAMVAIFAIGSVNAKQMGVMTSATMKATEIEKMAQQSPSAASGLYQKMSDHLSSMAAANDRFSRDFIASVKSSKLSPKEKTKLLLEAQDMYTSLSENCITNGDALNAKA